MTRVCLNMIVRNEAANIERCLRAVSPHVDCYVICDTGSTDETPALIRAHFDSAGVPGEVIHTRFVQFEQARNEALDAARASGLAFDYILFCDADMELEVADPAYRERLTAPAYYLTQRTASGTSYRNLRLLRRDVPARYRGVTHEYLDLGGAVAESLEGVAYLDHHSGGNRPGKFERDLALLDAALAAEPGSARHVFYRANTLYDLGRFDDAIAAYTQRIALAGWTEEVFYSHYRIGLCLARLGRDDAALARHLATYEAFPHRAEPLHAQATTLLAAKRYRLACHFAEIGRAIPHPGESALFVEDSVYEWRLYDIAAVSLYWLDRAAEAEAINRELLARVPDSERERIRANLGFCESRLAQRAG